MPRADDGAMSIRIATLGTLLTALALSVLLWLARPAEAGPATPPPAAAAVEDDFEGELEEIPEEACGLAEPWIEECEEAEEEEEEGELPPEECTLQTATARVLASRSRDRLTLLVRYTAVGPASAYIDLRFSSRRGLQSLGPVRRRLTTRGTIRLEESLPENRMDLARRARSYVLTVDVSGAPSYCRGYSTRRLSLRRTVHDQTLWTQRPQG
jgi:hypothetical protein